MTDNLNTALETLGETMADNLTTMGVTASASDGLTTLAGKILDVPTTPSTITLTTNKNILSYADSETATLTATYSKGAGHNLAVYNAVTGTKIGDMTDQNDGTYTYTYTSTGVGDISMTSASATTESNSISIEDCLRYDLATSDKTSSYGSIVAYRGGSGAWNYDSTHGYYGTISGDNEAMVTLTELTGLDTFTIEFDALFNTNEVMGIAGICAYESNSNYSRVSAHGTKVAERICINGTCNESESAISGISTGDTVHFKFEVDNNQIIETVTKNSSTIGTKTISYTVTQNTLFGLAFVWNNKWVSNTYITNLKVKV